MLQKSRVTRSQHQGLGEVRSEPRPHLRTRPKASFIAPAGFYHKLDSRWNAGCFYKSDSRWNLPINLYLRNDGHFGAFVVANNQQQIITQSKKALELPLGRQ